MASGEYQYNIDYVDPNPMPLERIAMETALDSDEVLRNERPDEFRKFFDQVSLASQSRQIDDGAAAIQGVDPIRAIRKIC